MPRKSIKKSQCFANSQLVIINDPSNQIKYHEGFCDTGFGIPIFHGWNSLNGKLLDFTLQYKGKIKFLEKSHIGIEVDKTWVLDCFRNKKHSTAYLENYNDDDDDVYSALNITVKFKDTIHNCSRRALKPIKRGWASNRFAIYIYLKVSFVVFYKIA